MQIDSTSVDTLPGTLSALMRLAIADMRLCISQGYTPNMADWHTPVDGGCHVCLAGAVMAQHLGTPKDRLFDWKVCDLVVNGKLTAINSVRTGDFAVATRYMRLPVDLDVCDRLRARWLSHGSIFDSYCLSWYWINNVEGWFAAWDDVITYMEKQGV